MTVNVRHAAVGPREYKATIEMDWLDVIRQEYVNHVESVTQDISAIIRVPERDTLTQAVETDNYTETSDTCENNGVPISCLQRVSGNYHANVTDGINYTYGRPLIYAESIRTQYITDTSVVTTPIITSAWRNPERNEIVGGSRTSNHLHGAAIDLIPDRDLVGDFPVVYDPDDPDAAASTWCQMAASAYDAGNARETLVENTRSARPSGVSAIYFRYDDDPSFDNCVTEVRRRIEGYTSPDDPSQNTTGCLDLATNPDPDVNNRNCSPNHIHTARQQ